MVVAQSKPQNETNKKPEKKPTFWEKVWRFFKALVFILLNVIIFILLLYSLFESLCNSQKLKKIDAIKNVIIKLCNAWTKVKNGKTIWQKIGNKILSMLSKVKEVGGERALTYLYYFFLLFLFLLGIVMFIINAVNQKFDLLGKIGLGIVVTLFFMLFFVNVFRYIVNKVPENSKGVANKIDDIRIGIFKVPVFIIILIALMITLLYTKIMYFEPHTVWTVFIIIYSVILMVNIILINLDKWTSTSKKAKWSNMVHSFRNMVNNSTNQTTIMAGGRRAPKKRRRK